MNSKNGELLSYLQANGSTPSQALLRHFGISRATLSRRIQGLEESVVKIGKTTSTSYAARKLNAEELPLYRIEESGKATHLGVLIPLVRDEWFLKSESKIPTLFYGEFKDGHYPGWPWFLADLRPSGFLGRAFARSLSEILNCDTNPGNWTDQQVAQAIAMFGTNLQGCLVVGERALDKLLNHGHDCIVRIPERNYPELAESALNDGSDFGSSAGGEQPKFTTYIHDGQNEKNVIVKFSPAIDSPAGRRWADLLFAEHIANQTLNQNGFETAKTRTHEIDQRVYLESQRFDRIGAKGRRGLVTLRALDAAFVGQGSGSWIKCAQKLHRARLISSEDCEQITRLWLFGELIANTDMHFGNLSFYLGDSFPLKLAPCYDMLPMQFRPAPSGEVTSTDFIPKQPLPEHESAWKEMHPLALEFWHALSQQQSVSANLRNIAITNHHKLHSLSSD